MKAKHWFPGLLMLAGMGAATMSAPQGYTQAARRVGRNRG